MSAAELGRIVVTYELGDAPAHDIETGATIIGEIPVALAVGLLAMASDTILRGKHGTEELEAVQAAPQLSEHADDVKRGEFPPPMFDLDAEPTEAVKAVSKALRAVGAVRKFEGHEWVNAPLDVAARETVRAIPEAQVEALNPEVLARALRREHCERMGSGARWDTATPEARNVWIRAAERVLGIIAEETTA